MKEYPHRGCMYLEDCFNPKSLTHIIDQVIKAIEQSKLDFDVIAFRGLSGAMVAPTVCVLTDKYPLAVRKEDGNHSCWNYEGPAGDFNYIIIDDGIASGSTLRTIIERTPGKCVGIFLYANARIGCFMFPWHEAYRNVPIFQLHGKTWTVDEYNKQTRTL